MRKGKIAKSGGHIVLLKGTAAPRLGPRQDGADTPNVAGQSVLAPHVYQTPNPDGSSRDRRRVVELAEEPGRAVPTQPGEPAYKSPPRRAHPVGATGEQDPRGPNTAPARRIRKRRDNLTAGSR